MLTSFDQNENASDNIVFANGSEGKVLALGKISSSTDHSISNVFLVSVSYNLLYLSLLCEMGYNCLFTNEGVTVFKRSDDSVAFKGVLKGKLYLVDFTKERAQLDTCLLAKSNMGWLWHHQLAHVGMRNLDKLLKGSTSSIFLIFSLIKIEFVVLVKQGNKLE
jgi:hypothetical protein